MLDRFYGMNKEYYLRDTFRDERKSSMEAGVVVVLITMKYKDKVMKKGTVLVY